MVSIHQSDNVYTFCVIRYKIEQGRRLYQRYIGRKNCQRMYWLLLPHPVNMNSNFALRLKIFWKNFAASWLGILYSKIRFLRLIRFLGYFILVLKLSFLWKKWTKLFTPFFYLYLSILVRRIIHLSCSY